MSGAAAEGRDPENKLIELLRQLVEHADGTYIHRGKTQSWKLSDPDLPMREGVQFVRGRLEALK